jgi:predicted dehydrogenase
MGVIGCGAIAQVMHLPYMAEYSERFQIVALADAYQPALDATADRYGVTHRYTDWRDLMARDDIDAVGIFHSGSHRDTIIAALDANKHIFVEKPLAWNLREAREVAERVRQSDRVVQVAYHKLYDPAFAYTKAHLDKMRDIGFARITVLHPANELGLSPYRIRRGNGVIEEGHVDAGTWERQRDGQLSAFAGGALSPLVDEVLGEARKGDTRLRLGYGIITISLIHQIYMLHGFLGAPNRVLHCEIYRDGLSIHALLEYPNNLRVTLDWHFLSHLKDYREEYAFFGNHDRVIMQLPAPYFRNFPSPVIIQGGEDELSWEKRVIVSYDEAFRLELMAFHDNVTQGATPRSSVETAIEHMTFVQALIDAAR